LFQDPVIISTGGGAFVQPNGRALMLATSTIIWLDVPFELIVERIRKDKENERPLAKNLDDPEKLEAFRKLYRKHYPLYKRAHVHIDASQQPDEVVEEILRKVPQLSSPVC
jgi:shikimate kinase